MMHLSTDQKLQLSEVIYLFLISVVSPFFVGIEIWGTYSFTFSLIFVNFLQLPTIILFYRVLLPQTLMRGRVWQFLLLMPVYLFIYELNSRLATITTIHMPFIPQGYKDLLIPVHAEEFNWNFNQSLGYTCLILLTASSLALMRTLFKQQGEVYRVTLEKVNLGSSGAARS
ncbi:MAG: hypothetical protein EOO88_39720 [Pedobacter sp.]|nr:MAG: hypothetical protein EOO88_39720 [Pedobacter sp.]